MATRTKILIEMVIEGDRADAYHVVDTMLENGCPQDDINDHVNGDAGPLHVVSAVCRYADDAAAALAKTRVIDRLVEAPVDVVENHCDECGAFMSECTCAEDERECRACAGLSNDGHDPESCTRDAE